MPLEYQGPEAMQFSYAGFSIVVRVVVCPCLTNTSGSVTSMKFVAEIIIVYVPGTIGFIS